MLKEPLDQLVKARVDKFTKSTLGLLMAPLGYRDEADIARAAYRDFIRKHITLIAKAQQNRTR